MKISTEIDSACRHTSHEKVIEGVAKAGFDAFDFSLFELAQYDDGIIDEYSPLKEKNYLKFVRKLKQIAVDNGIFCNQSHAPFPTHIKEVYDMLKRAIECTAEMGGEICVIHPDNNKPPQENAEMYFELLPFAKDCGVKIAAENMYNWGNDLNHATPAACSSHADFLEHIKAVNDPYFVACLDLGHAEMKGLNTDAVTMIKTLGSHLQALHIHDNDLLHDSHQIPFSMNIDYMPIIKALKEINYSGIFTLEAVSYLEDKEDVFEGLRELAISARRLADMFEGFSPLA